MVIKNSIVLFSIVTLAACFVKQSTISVVDELGVFSETRSPASVEVALDAGQLQAAKEGRLGLVYRLNDTDSITIMRRSLNTVHHGNSHTSI